MWRYKYLTPLRDNSKKFQCDISEGLRLVANIQQDQYTSGVGSTAGIIVLVHPQNTMPFPEDDGILVSPGYSTDMAISLVLYWYLTVRNSIGYSSAGDQLVGCH